MIPPKSLKNVPLTQKYVSIFTVLVSFHLFGKDRCASRRSLHLSGKKQESGFFGSLASQLLDGPKNLHNCGFCKFKKMMRFASRWFSILAFVGSAMVLTADASKETMTFKDVSVMVGKRFSLCGCSLSFEVPQLFDTAVFPHDGFKQRKLPTEEDVKKKIKEYSDKNKDGTVSEQEKKATFDEFDTDKNGKLNKDELKAGLIKAGVDNWVSFIASALLKKCDNNGDGEITPDELPDRVRKLDEGKRTRNHCSSSFPDASHLNNAGFVFRAMCKRFRDGLR